MDDAPYMGAKPGNVDILVHFKEKIGQPREIHNVDPDKFEMFDAHDAVYMLAEDEGLPPCYPFSLWLLCGGIGKILPLEIDIDMLKRFEENKNTSVTRRQSDDEIDFSGSGIRWRKSDLRVRGVDVRHAIGRVMLLGANMAEAGFMVGCWYL
ncbi:hypothetical protein E2542_SST28612 [Spatholobus suberectus]|nr:hypothetical protein E2542_SST28612 [Spatholobus suberectus]